MLESREEDSPSPRSGGALLAFYDSARDVIRGGNAAAEHILNKAEDSGVSRLTLYGSLIREYLYMEGKIVSIARVPFQM